MMAIVAVIFGSCSNEGEQPGSRDLVIFHAGSLSVPIKQIADEFERGYSGVRVLLEQFGHLTLVEP